MAELLFHPLTEFVRLAQETPSSALLRAFAFVVHFTAQFSDTYVKWVA